jgi:formate--tetrahydrofolate ligase
MWHRGGAGGEELAKAVNCAASVSSTAQYLYSLDAPIKDKIQTIATEMCGAKDVFYLPEAERQIRRSAELGWDRLPICIPKTQHSLSDNPELKAARAVLT